MSIFFSNLNISKEKEICSKSVRVMCNSKKTSSTSSSAVRKFADPDQIQIYSHDNQILLRPDRLNQEVSPQQSKIPTPNQKSYQIRDIPLPPFKSFLLRDVLHN